LCYHTDTSLLEYTFPVGTYKVWSHTVTLYPTHSQSLLGRFLRAKYRQSMHSAGVVREVLTEK
jgi:hypothetical protein